MEDEKPAPGAPEPPPAASATAEAPTTAKEPASPVELRCKCGAGPHPEREGFCANSHPLVGHGGRLSLKHGRYAQQPTDADTPMETVPHRLEVLRQLREAIIRDLARYATGRMTPREQAQALSLDDRLADIDARIAALEAEAPTAATEQAADDAWPRRLALLFANEPDHFTEFLTLLLEADRARCGPLRTQTRLVLDHIEPAGKPVWRGRSDDADEVLL
jgi:hypothetical protein